AVLFAGPFLAGVGCGCSHDDSPSYSCRAAKSDAGRASKTWRHPNGNLVVEVTAQPFALEIKDRAENILMESAAGNCDPASPYAALAVTHNETQPSKPVITGWDSYRGTDGPWRSSTWATPFT